MSETTGLKCLLNVAAAEEMADNWHQKCVALVSGVVVKKTLGGKTEPTTRSCLCML